MTSSMERGRMNEGAGLALAKICGSLIILAGL
jgi:hypothetical protein